MKTSALSSLFGAAVLALGCLAPSLALAAPLTAKSKIIAVTVYTDRAMVTRSAPVELPATGLVEVEFDRLPASMVDRSLTVSGRGSAQATILDVTTREVHVDATPNDRVKALEEELRSLAKKRRSLEDRSTVVKAREVSLGRLEAAATAAPSKDGAPRLTLEESDRLLAFLDEQLTQLFAENAALDTQVEDLAAPQAALERQLGLLRGSGAKSYKAVTVRLQAFSAGALDLALGYAVPGASWTPSYDARAASNAAEIELSYFGHVRQNTGEDWKDVALTLSTARPSLGGGAPEAGVWAVDVFSPWAAAQTMFGSVAMAPTVSATTTVTLDAFRVQSSGQRSRPASPPLPPPIEAAAAQASVETAVTSASFKLVATATVPSDNSPQKVPVTATRFAATPEYLATPKKLAAAFLTARVVNTSDFPLLAGTMNVFLDGTFVTTSSLRAVMPGEKFDLALGADEGIAVKHKRVQRFSEDIGLTSRGRRVTYEYLVTIQNNKKSAARVVVADHVPVSRNEKVVVKVTAPAEKEMKPTNDGALKWTLDLKPGDTREITLKFSVEHPGEVQVAGLE